MVLAVLIKANIFYDSYIVALTLYFANIKLSMNYKCFQDMECIMKFDHS